MDGKLLTDMLREHPFLEGLKPNYVQKLAEVALEVQFARDQVIFHEGDESSLFYLLVSGKVALEISAPGRVVRIQTLGEGDEMGWSSLLGQAGKTFQARSLEPVRALAFDALRLRQIWSNEPAFGYEFMVRLLKVVAQRLQAARLQLLDLYAPRGVKLV